MFCHLYANKYFMPKEQQQYTQVYSKGKNTHTNNNNNKQKTNFNDKHMNTIKLR